MQDHEQPAPKQSLAELTAGIVSAYVSNNAVPVGEIGRLISEVSRQLDQLDKPQGQAPERPEPAVTIRRSIGKDHLICLVCGKKQRMLKRHLTNEHQLTPDEYRRLFDLKLDYPMVAPSYAAMRRDLALKIGLGRPKKAEPPKKAKAKRAGTLKAETPTKARPTRTRAA